MLRLRCFAFPRSGNLGLLSGSSSAVERQLPKLDVAGSIPVSRSNLHKKPSGARHWVKFAAFKAMSAVCVSCHLCLFSERLAGPLEKNKWHETQTALIALK